jgi:hypothetical protein
MAVTWVLVAGSPLLLAACSGGSPSSATKTTSATTTAPVEPTVAACAQSSVSASVDYTQFGHPSSSLAGAVVFRDTGSAPCTLQGEPIVAMTGTDGSAISTYQAPGPTDVPAAVLTPASGTGARAASSITFSDWTCPLGSFSVSVRFPRWTSSVPAGTGAGSTTSTTAATTTSTTPPSCTQKQVTGQTVYMGPVTLVTG